MKTYLPRTAALQEARGLWCVEAAWMDRIDEAYFLGGDFDGRRDCCFYYMVWPDAEVCIWNVGLNLHGQLDVPFSTTRCVILGGYRSLRDALAAAEDHACKRLGTGRSIPASEPAVMACHDLPDSSQASETRENASGNQSASHHYA